MAMDPKLYQELIEIFKDELNEQHQLIIDSLIALENTSDKNVSSECIQVLFRSSHNIKGAAKSVDIDSIAAISHKLEDVFSEWRDQDHLPSKEKINFCLGVADNMLVAMQDFNQKIIKPISYYLVPLDGGIQSSLTPLEILNTEEQIKVPLTRLKQINGRVDDFLTHKLMLNLMNKEFEGLYKNISDIKNNTDAIKKKIIGMKDKFELVVDDFSRNLSVIQSDLLDLRMQSISGILTPLKRTARDLSKKLNKPTSLEVEGSDVKIDRSVLVLLRDPFQHLLRNSIEHGVEDTATRLNKSKPATAIISIKVIQRFGNIQIEFCDNGKGLDKHKILEKVRSKLKYTQEEMARLTDEKLYDLIFQSDFSTQSEVSELSGRGVGLDAVRNNIEQAGGHISVASTEGQGTCFNIIVPQNLSSSRGVFVLSSDKTFVLPTRYIKKLFFIDSKDIHNIGGKNRDMEPIVQHEKHKDKDDDGVFEHYLEQSNENIVFIQHKKRTPVRYLNSLFEDLPISMYIEKRDYQAILLEANGNEVLVLVDEILHEDECLIKSLPVPLNKLKIYEGVTLTGNGELLPVFNAAYLIKFFLSAKITNLK